jgi:hypothetical protein
MLFKKADYLIPPEVPWKDFKYYKFKLDKMIEKKERI